MYSVTLNLFEGNRNRQQRVAVNFSSDVSEDFEKFLSNKPCGKVQSAPPELQLGEVVTQHTWTCPDMRHNTRCGISTGGIMYHCSSHAHR